MSFYSFARGLVSVFCHLCFRIRVEGMENIPEGNCLVCANHKSNFDPPVLGTSLPIPVRFMAKEELFKNKLMDKILRAVGAFPIKRGKSDVGALRGAMKMLEGGESLAIFPEGGRSRGETLRRGKQGAALIAVKSGVNILPVGIAGEYGLFRKITIKIGEIIPLDEYFEEKVTSEDLQKITDEKIMPAIGALAGVKTYENRNC